MGKTYIKFPKTETSNTTPQPPVRKSRTSRFANKSQLANETKPFNSSITPTPQSNIIEITSDPEIQKASNKITTSTASVPTDSNKSQSTAAPSVTPKKKRVLRPRKALITLTSSAVQHLQGLLDQPDPKLIRIGVRNRGCSGLTYNLEYVDKPGKFDELVEQDGVKVLIDSKALFSIVGSEMDWLDDKLSSRFIFKIQIQKELVDVVNHSWYNSIMIMIAKIELYNLIQRHGFWTNIQD